MKEDEERVRVGRGEGEASVRCALEPEGEGKLRGGEGSRGIPEGGANWFLSRVKEAARRVVSRASPGHLTRPLPPEMPCSESMRRAGRGREEEEGRREEEGSG